MVQTWHVTAIPIGNSTGSSTGTANGLLDLGVTKGDRINLHLTNCPEFLFFWFAIAKIGAVMVPTNPLSPLDELTYPAKHSESKVSVTQPDLLPTVVALRERCPTIGQIILTGSTQARARCAAVRSVCGGPVRPAGSDPRWTPWTRRLFCTRPVPPAFRRGYWSRMPTTST